MTSVAIFDMQCVFPQPKVSVLLKRSSLGEGAKKKEQSDFETLASAEFGS